MSAYWIVVANAARARIFEAEATDSAMREVIDLAHPDSRRHAGDLVSDRAGHVLSGTTGGHSIDRGERAKQHAADVFAREICEQLERGRQDQSYRKLYLVAEPQFLGLLRQHMGKPLHDVVRAEVAKDLTTAGEKQIREQVM